MYAIPEREDAEQISFKHTRVHTVYAHNSFNILYFLICCSLRGVNFTVQVTFNIDEIDGTIYMMGSAKVAFVLSSSSVSRGILSVLSLKLVGVYGVISKEDPAISVMFCLGFDPE